MGELRNGIVVASGDVVLAFPGSYGTLSELAYAAQWGKDIIVICKDDFPVPIRDILLTQTVKYVKNIEEVELALREYHGF